MNTKVSTAPRCSLCHSDLDLCSRWYVEIHPEEWPLALNFIAVVICAGELLAFPRLGSALLSLISVLPVFIRFAERLYCERCEIELDDDI